jgi:hypothetical protein
MKTSLMAFAVAAALGYSSIGLAALSKDERKVRGRAHQHGAQDAAKSVRQPEGQRQGHLSC